MHTTPRMCRECGRMVIFLPSPSGTVCCNSFSVKVVPDKSGRMYFLGDGKTMWGRAAAPGEANAVTAWESHYAMCPESRRRDATRRRKKTKTEIEEARKRAEAEAERVKALLLARREKEWASGGV